MAGSVLIVDIRARNIFALVLNPQTKETTSFETPLVEELPEALKDAMEALLKEMEREGIDCNFSQTMVALSPAAASIREITLPFTESRKVEEVLPFELSDSIVGNIEDMIVGSLPLFGGRTLAVSVERREIERVIDIFDTLGLSVPFVGISLLYKGRLLSGLHGLTGTAALIDATSIVVIKDSSSVLYSFINDITDLKFALASLGAQAIEVESFYATDRARGWLEELDISSEPSEPYNDDNIDTLALVSLYGEGALKDPMNFRKGPLTDKSEFESTRKSLRLATVLIVLLACFWSASIYSRARETTKELAKIEGRLQRAYSELFTDESVVDPFYQMEVKIKELGEERAFVSGGIDVLGTLKGLDDGAKSISGKDSRLKLFEVKMRTRRVVARGETENFDTADKFKDTLSASPKFNDISLTDVKKNSSGGVSFSIALKLKDGK